MSAKGLQVPYEPPKHLLEVLAVLDFEEALTPRMTHVTSRRSEPEELSALRTAWRASLGFS